MPRTLLCTMRRGERAHGEGPRGTKHKQGKQPEKGARGGTRAKEENAAHHVVYHARHASDLSRRVVGEACRQVRGEQAHQALVCPRPREAGGKQRCNRMCTRTGECRAPCSEGGGARGVGVVQIGQCTRGKEGTGRAKEGGEAEGARQGHRRGKKAEGCHAPCAQRQEGPGHGEERVPCTLLCNVHVRGRVQREGPTGKHRAGKGRERERERGSRQSCGVACNLRAVTLSRTDENWGSPRCGLKQVESQRLGTSGVPRAAGRQARPGRGDPAERRKSMVQCRATCQGRSGTEGEQRGTTGRTGRQARESTGCRAETATEGRTSEGQRRARKQTGGEGG